MIDKVEAILGGNFRILEHLLSCLVFAWISWIMTFFYWQESCILQPTLDKRLESKMLST